MNDKPTRIELSKREAMVFVALLGTCAVCGVAAYLGSVRALGGLGGVLLMVMAIGKMDDE